MLQEDGEGARKFQGWREAVTFELGLEVWVGVYKQREWVWSRRALQSEVAT